MAEWYNPDETKKKILCIMNGCKVCTAPVYCKTHDKPASDTAPGVPTHCYECGEFIYDEKRDTKGMFK